ncbi:MAG TPA: hypothetical protein VFE42_32520 [Chloroflexota bacterium]|nr:hypothetical protein [Chloroflexota bacterium]
MSAFDRPELARLVLQRCQILGHTIPRIQWEPSGAQGSGTCTRCGDGVVLYVEAEGCAVGGTAYDTECPGASCAHGWSIVRRARGGVLLRCLHCGAERSEDVS